MRRRDFLRTIGGGMWATFGFLAGCGRIENDNLTARNVNYISIGDIRLRAPVGRITNESGQVVDRIKAHDIVAKTPVTLYVDEGSHKHPFTLGAEQYQSLIEGQDVRMTTARAAGHDHGVRISPRDQIAGTQIEVPDDSGAKMFAALDESDSPYLYAAADKELNGDSVQYCRDTIEACNANNNLWKPMVKYDLKGKMVYRSGAGLQNISDGSFVYIKGKVRDSAKDAGALVKFVQK